MLSRILMILLLWAFVFSGCAAEKWQFQSETRREYREQRIQAKNPHWDNETAQKVASRQVEPGMTSEMVRAALGEPDTVSRQGDEEKWGYATFVERGDAPPDKKFVYFVHLKDARVVRTTGDRSRLRYHYW
jgi:outer membrane protein assembly factor BamE (lipoprotein component of BamABCDE complex)